MANRVITQNELMHYGVTGMKWGVRKQSKFLKGETGYISPRATLSRKDQKEQQFLEDPKEVYDKVYRRAAPQIRRGTRLLNDDPRFKGQDFKKPSDLRSQYYKEYSELVTKQLNAASSSKANIFSLRRLGMSPHKTLQMKFSFDYEKELRASYDIAKADTQKAIKVARSDAKKETKQGNPFNIALSKFKHSADEDAADQNEILIESELDETGFLNEKSDMILHSNLDAENFIKHYYEESYAYPSVVPVNQKPPEADKTKSISEMTTEELRRMMSRLRDEREVEDIIRSLRRSAGLKDSYENPAKIDTKTPVDQLYHWGILGQKWGVRRFQNKDGSRTAAGKRREEEQEKSEDYVKTRESRKKGSASLSNEELRRINERLRLEADYKNLTTEKMEKAESFVGKALKKAAGEALTDFAKSAMVGAAKLMVKEISPEFAEVAFSIKKPAAAAAASKQEAEKKKQTK